MCTFIGSRVKVAMFSLMLFPLMSFAQDIPEELIEKCGLSADFTIENSTGMPENHIAYSGILKGQWDKKLDSYVIVESIDDDGEFDGYYYWGVYEDWGIPEAGCTQVSGSIKKKKMSFESGTAFQSYKLKSKYISATFRRNGRTTNGRFQKLE